MTRRAILLAWLLSLATIRPASGQSAGEYLSIAGDVGKPITGGTFAIRGSWFHQAIPDLPSQTPGRYDVRYGRSLSQLRFEASLAIVDRVAIAVSIPYVRTAFTHAYGYWVSGCPGSAGLTPLCNNPDSYMSDTTRTTVSGPGPAAVELRLGLVQTRTLAIIAHGLFRSGARQIGDHPQDMTGDRGNDIGIGLRVRVADARQQRWVHAFATRVFQMSYSRQVLRTWPGDYWWAGMEPGLQLPAGFRVLASAGYLRRSVDSSLYEFPFGAASSEKIPGPGEAQSALAFGGRLSVRIAGARTPLVPELSMEYAHYRARPLIPTSTPSWIATMPRQSVSISLELRGRAWGGVRVATED